MAELAEKLYFKPSQCKITHRKLSTKFQLNIQLLTAHSATPKIKLEHKTHKIPQWININGLKPSRYDSSLLEQKKTYLITYWTNRATNLLANKKLFTEHCNNQILPNSWCKTFPQTQNPLTALNHIHVHTFQPSAGKNYNKKIIINSDTQQTYANI